jgi:hypothetical protein
MDNIFDTDSTFKFENITMTTPTSVGSGTYFSKIFVSAAVGPIGRAENKVPLKNPLYIQSPKCKTRQGIVQSGKKIHADLVFTNDDEEFIQWMETLEQTVKKNIYNNRGKWFDTDMDEDDVDSYMTPTMKIFKSGKQYLMRVNVSQRIGTTPLKIYDEDECTVEMGSINDTTSIITILEIQGVRCSSKSFQIDIELKQIMVLKPVNLFEKCIIKSRDRPLDRPLEKLVSPPQTDPIVENVVLKPVAEEPVAEEPVAEEPVEESIHIEIEDDNTLAKNIDIEEFDLNIDTIENTDTVQLKEKTEVYYQMYREAKQKAKLAKSLALSSYMEARRIKNLYMLDDVDSSDDEDFELE